MIAWLCSLFVRKPEPDFRSAKTLRLRRPRATLRPPAGVAPVFVTVPKAGRLGFKRARLRAALLDSLARRGRHAP